MRRRWRANGVIGWEGRGGKEGEEVLEDMKEAVVTTRKEVGWKILLGDQHSSRDN